MEQPLMPLVGVRLNLAAYTGLVFVYMAITLGGTALLTSRVDSWGTLGVLHFGMIYFSGCGALFLALACIQWLRQKYNLSFQGWLFVLPLLGQAIYWVYLLTRPPYNPNMLSDMNELVGASYYLYLITFPLAVSVQFWLAE
jgi:formate hydrogenlyase subunit 4